MKSLKDKFNKPPTNNITFGASILLYDGQDMWTFVRGYKVKVEFIIGYIDPETIKNKVLMANNYPVATPPVFRFM